jgi:hypothetical protein
MAGIFQDRGKGDTPLSGHRTGPAHDRRWVDLRLSAFSGFLATAGLRTNLGQGLSEKSL